MDTFTTTKIDELERTCRRLERQNQALKHSLYFTLEALRNLLEVIQPDSPTIGLIISHQKSLNTLLPQQKASGGGNHSGFQNERR